MFTSPGDPAFWVHHTQMDRMWSLWQELDPEKRHSESEMNGGQYGHVTWNNEPASRKASFEDPIELGWAGGATTVGEVMDTLGGELCYVYV